MYYCPPARPPTGIVVMFVPGCLDSTQDGRRARPLPSEDEESPRVSGNGLAAPDVRRIMSPRRKPVGSVPRAARALCCVVRVSASDRQVAQGVVVRRPSSSSTRRVMVLMG